MENTTYPKQKQAEEEAKVDAKAKPKRPLPQPGTLGQKAKSMPIAPKARPKGWGRPKEIETPTFAHRGRQKKCRGRRLKLQLLKLLFNIISADQRWAYIFWCWPACWNFQSMLDWFHCIQGTTKSSMDQFGRPATDINMTGLIHEDCWSAMFACWPASIIVSCCCWKAAPWNADQHCSPCWTAGFNNRSLLVSKWGCICLNICSIKILHKPLVYFFFMPALRPRTAWHHANGTRPDLKRHASAKTSTD